MTRAVPFGKDFPEYSCPVPTHPRLDRTGESREAGCLPQRPGAGIPSYLRRDAASTDCPRDAYEKCSDTLAPPSIHQAHQLLFLHIAIRLRRVESFFSAAEGFEGSGSFELPGSADEDAVGGACAMEIVPAKMRSAYLGLMDIRTARLFMAWDGARPGIGWWVEKINRKGAKVAEGARSFNVEVAEERICPW